MPLKWKLENEWFSSEDIGIVKDKQILTNTSKYKNFDLTAVTTPKKIVTTVIIGYRGYGRDDPIYGQQVTYEYEDPGEILLKDDKYVFRSNTNYGSAYDSHYLYFHFDVNTSVTYNQPYVLSFNVELNEYDDNFECGFIKCNNSYIQIKDIKRDGSHGLAIVDSTNTIDYRLTKTSFKIYLEFYNKTICNIKIDDVIIGSIPFPDIYENDLRIYTSSVGEGGIDISDINIERIIETQTPLKPLVKIEESIQNGEKYLTARTLIPNIVFDEEEKNLVQNFKIVLTAASSINRYPYLTMLSSGKFEHLNYERCLSPRNASATSETVVFSDIDANEYKCQISVSSRWSDNGNDDYAPHNLFALEQSQRISYDSCVFPSSGYLTLTIEFLDKVNINLLQDLRIYMGNFGQITTYRVDFYTFELYDENNTLIYTISGDNQNVPNSILYEVHFLTSLDDVQI